MALTETEAVILHDVAKGVAVLQMQMKEVVGEAGTGGTLNQIANRLASLEKWRWVITGAVIVLLGELQYVLQFILFHVVRK